MVSLAITLCERMTTCKSFWALVVYPKPVRPGANTYDCVDWYFLQREAKEGEFQSLYLPTLVPGRWGNDLGEGCQWMETER